MKKQSFTRLIAAIFVIVFAVALYSVSAFAAGDSATLTADTAKAARGREVTVTVNVTSEGVKLLGVVPTFDEEAFDLTGGAWIFANLPATKVDSVNLTSEPPAATLMFDSASELSDVERIDELLAKRDSYAQRLNRSVENLEIVQKTMDLLNEASAAMTSRYIGGTKARFEHYLELIGDSGEFAMDTDFVLKKLDRGETRPAESYSKGTRELHSFCLRLALSDSLYGGDVPFLMLDDPFTSLDSKRLERAKSLISGISKEKQVIYFTCSKERMI